MIHCAVHDHLKTSVVDVMEKRLTKVKMAVRIVSAINP